MRNFLNSGLFFSAILLFFLPFLELRCGDGSVFAKMNGFDLAFAQGLKFENPESTAYFEENTEYMQMMEKQKKPDYFTMSTLILLAAGGFIQFWARSKREHLAILFSGLAILILSSMMMLFSHVWERQMESMNQNPFFGKMIAIVLAFGNGIWLVISACTLIIIINIIFIMRDRKESYLKVYSPETNTKIPDAADN